MPGRSWEGLIVMRCCGEGMLVLWLLPEYGVRLEALGFMFGVLRAYGTLRSLCCNCRCALAACTSGVRT